MSSYWDSSRYELYPSSRFTATDTFSSPTTTSSHNFLTFLAATQFYKVDILPFNWDFALESAGPAGTAKIYESPLDVNRDFVFKRTRFTNTDANDSGTYNALVSEMSILCHPLLRQHPYIINLKGISWEITEKGDGVWPVIVLDKAPLGDLNYFLTTEEGKNLTFKKRSDLCAGIASAIRALHGCNGVHGDVKPHNVFIYVCPHAKISAQMADFGWSFLPRDGDRNVIDLPKSLPWYAPEYHHRGFTIEQAQKQDVFSFGVLCFWVLFHADISAKARDSRNGKGYSNSAIQQTREIHILLEEWKIEGRLQAVAVDMVAASGDHTTTTKEVLRQLFVSTLAHDPNERESNFEGLENMFKQLDPKWISPRFPRYEQKLPSLSSMYHSFRIGVSFFQLLEGDYRVRQYLAHRLEEYANSIPGNHIHYGTTAYQLAVCYQLGFGVSRDAEKAKYWVQRSGYTPEDLEKQIELARQFKSRRPYLSDDLMSLAQQGLLNRHRINRPHMMREIWNTEIPFLIKEIEDLASVVGRRHIAVQELQHSLSTIFQQNGLFKDAEALQVEEIEALLNEPQILEDLKNQNSAPKPLSPLTIKTPRSIESSPVLSRIELFSGKHHPSVARAMDNLVNIFMHQCRWTEAEWFCTQVRDALISINGGHHPNTLHSIFKLGYIHGQQGRSKEAEKAYQHTLHLCENYLGKEHWQTLQISEALANLYHHDGYNWKDTEELLMPGLNVDLKTSRSNDPESYSQLRGNATLEEQFFEMSKNMLESGSPDMSLIAGMSTIAQMRSRQKRFPEAERLMQQSIEICKTALSKDHSETLMQMKELATLLIKQGRYNEAESLLEEVVERSDRVLGKSAMISLDAASNLAATYFRLGRLGEAERLMQATLVAQKDLLGDDHPNTLISSTNLACPYQTRGNRKEAITLLEHTVERMENVLGDENEYVFTSLDQLMKLYLQEHRYDESEKLCRSLVRRQEKVLGLGHLSLCNSLLFLATCLSAQGRYGDATPLVERSSAITTEIFDKTSIRALDGLMYLGLAYQREERWEDGEKVFGEVVGTAMDALGPDHRLTKVAMAQLEFGKRRKWPES